MYTKFLINYKTNKYDLYYTKNSKILKDLKFKIYNTEDIETFLQEYGYFEQFEKIIPKSYSEHWNVSILCDFFRLCVLYEFGGMYFDSDIIFNDNMYTFDEYISKFKNRDVIIFEKSLYFIKTEKGSPFIKCLIDKFIGECEIDKILLNDINLLQHRSNIAFVFAKSLEKYFTHDEVHIFYH
jgi:mannosyltransferase OCH1-like enzyme